MVSYHGHGQHVFMGLVIIIWSWSLQLDIYDGHDQLVFVISVMVMDIFVVLAIEHGQGSHREKDQIWDQCC